MSIRSGTLFHFLKQIFVFKKAQRVETMYLIHKG